MIMEREKPKISRQINCIVASFTTAASRIHMHRHLLRIVAAGGIIVYYDTGSYVENWQVKPN
jgi:hypothetical protein